jgi:Protein of unknown function (DUF1236)
MMSKLPLLSTVAASLLLTVGMASAQTEHKVPERAPPAQQNAPAEKIAPTMHAGEHKAPETTGQDVKSLSPGHGESATNGQSPKVSESGKTEMNEKGSTGTPKESKGNVEPKSSAATRSETKGSTGTNAEDKSAASKNATSKSDASQKSSESANDQSTTTGQGAAAGSAKLSTEQRSKITTVIKKQKVQSTRVNISVHVGARAPTSVHYHGLPTEVVDVYPEWRGYVFILVSDEILIIDPHTHLIVAVLEA